MRTGSEGAILGFADRLTLRQERGRAVKIGGFGGPGYRFVTGRPRRPPHVAIERSPMRRLTWINGAGMHIWEVQPAGIDRYGGVSRTAEAGGHVKDARNHRPDGRQRRNSGPLPP